MSNNDDIVYLQPDDINGQPDTPIQLTPEGARAYLWTIGSLDWKLYDSQKEIYNIWANYNGQKFILNCSRRFGKSYMLCLIAIEYALKYPKSRICYAAPTAKMVKKIIAPIFKDILEDCPRELRPVWKAQDQIYLFHNQSEIHIAGTDAERAEALRGQSMHLGIVDEAGFMSQMDYVVSDILMPQTLTTDGKIIIASTPPKTPAHDFTQYAIDAAIRGNYIKRTIYDNHTLSKTRIIRTMMETQPSLTKEQAEEYYMQRSGPKNSTWLREYMAEFVTDEAYSVIPEFTEELSKELVQECPKPPFFDCYVSMDVGYNDFTAVLFGYWDFFEAKLIIEDEIVMNRMTSATLANEIKNKELFLWNGKRPYVRVSDTDLIVLSDLQRTHGVNFVPTPKDNKEAAINKVRMMIADKKILINPRCKNLINHLKFAVWNKQKTQFERSGDYGHFDLVDALVYMVRNVQTNRNPVPAGHGLNIHTQFIPPQNKKSYSEVQMGKLLNLKKYFKDWNK